MTPPAFIQPGQRLVIPRVNNQYSAAPPVSRPATRLASGPGYVPAGPAAGNGVHVVQPGESLTGIARRVGENLP